MRLKTYRYDLLTREELSRLFRRPPLFSDSEEQAVKQIIHSVEMEGDAAVMRYTAQFDAPVASLKVDAGEWEQGLASVSDAAMQALEFSAANIESFHRLQIPRSIEIETRPGVICRREWRPINPVGLYAPGGTAPLISTVLMLGIPAQLAGCGEVILCTPPGKNGTLAPEMLAAAKIAGIRTIFKAGGSQAIAAMAIGTETIPKVNKIFGPGNRYVVAAKSIVAQSPYSTGIDMLAGPSELMIIADENADVRALAADLLTQTEHGPDSQVVLICQSIEVTDQVSGEIEKRLERIPRRYQSESSLARSFVIIVNDLNTAIDLANAYAPEHLMLSVSNPDRLLPEIQNAGSVFAGANTSVVFGDYASGTNHTLPTGGAAVYCGSLSVEDFMKSLTIQSTTKHGAATLAPVAAKLARLEGLDAHAEAALLRASGKTEAVRDLRSVDKMVRQQFPSLKPYSSARSEAVRGTLFLDANELSQTIQHRTFGGVTLQRYPDPYHTVLRGKLSQLIGVKEEFVFTGNGSDEIIDLLIRLFCDPDDAIAVLEPTYGVYEVAGRIHGCGVIPVPLNHSFQFDAASVLRSLPGNVKIVFCCSPNNPTGNLLNAAQISELVEKFRGIVVLDEAYIEFSKAKSFAASAVVANNLVVLRTLSKAWGLAGIRVGYCISNAEIISYLMRIKPPYNISVLSLHAATEALNDPASFNKAVATVVTERERMRVALKSLVSVQEVFESQANFLLTRFRVAKKAYETLLRYGIVARRRSEDRLKDCLRITVGSRSENDLVLRALREAE